jgi:PKD repeat protein
LQIGALGCPTDPSITFDPANPLAGESVDIEGSVATTGGGGIITFTWNLGDGSGLVTGTTFVKHTYYLDGIYTVTLTATGESCASPPSVQKAITVGFGPSATILFFPVILKNYPPIIFPTDTGAPAELLVNAVPPAQVTGLRGDASPVGATRLAWSSQPSPGEALAGYHIYRGAQIDPPAFHLLATVPATTTTYTDSAATCGQIYYVTAFAAAGESPASTSAYYSPACR